MPVLWPALSRMPNTRLCESSVCRIRSTLSSRPRPRTSTTTIGSSSLTHCWFICTHRTSSSSAWMWNAQRRLTIGSTSSGCSYSTSSIRASWLTTPRRIVPKRCRRTSRGLSPIRSCSPSTWSTSCSPSCKTSCCYSHNRTHISRR
jgi:hypothetical protein